MRRITTASCLAIVVALGACGGVDGSVRDLTSDRGVPGGDGLVCGDASFEAGAPNIPDGTWFVWGGSSCSPRLADGTGDDQAEVRLDDRPSADDTQVDLLARERRCASGRSADGRIDTCSCPDGTYEVVVRGGEVVSRRGVDEADSAAAAEPGPATAPSITEVLDRLCDAYQQDPDSIIDIAVEQDGMLIRVAFDPSPGENDVAYRFRADVDSPGDPPRGR